jgi:hypothetical protein
VDPFDGHELRLALATGGSQSAMRLGSYLNIADQRDAIFNGIFLLVALGNAPVSAPPGAARRSPIGTEHRCWCSTAGGSRAHA